jgi:hypothetical protein
MYSAIHSKENQKNCKQLSTPSPTLFVCVFCVSILGYMWGLLAFKLDIKKTLRHRKKIQSPYECCNWYDGPKCILYDWSFSHVIAKLLAEKMHDCQYPLQLLFIWSIHSGLSSIFVHAHEFNAIWNLILLLCQGQIGWYWLEHSIYKRWKEILLW